MILSNFSAALQNPDDSDQTELWADMFMTWVLANQGQTIRETLIGWDFYWARDANFKRTYTWSVVKRLMLGHDDLPGLGATDEEKLRFVQPIAQIANPVIGYGEDDLSD